MQFLLTHELCHRKFHAHACAFHKLTHQRVPSDDFERILSVSYSRSAIGGTPYHGSRAASCRERTKPPSNPAARIHGWGCNEKRRGRQGLYQVEAAAAPASIHGMGRSWGQSALGVDLCRLQHRTTIRHSSRCCWEGVLHTWLAAPTTSGL